MAEKVKFPYCGTCGNQMIFQSKDFLSYSGETGLKQMRYNFRCKNQKWYHLGILSHIERSMFKEV